MPSENTQVREALDAARKFIEVEYADHSAEPDGEWLAKEARHIHARVCAAIASLPDRAPDMKGVEPVAAYTIDCVGTEHMSRDVAGIERIAREGSEGPTPVGYFYASPELEQARLREPVVEPLGYVWQNATDRWRFNQGPMSDDDIAFFEAQPVYLATPPELEQARLRERVAELEAERKILRAELGGQNADAALKDWRDLRDALEAAEARLAQAERETERLRFEGDLDKWMKIIGAGITGYQPEAYAVMDDACRELVSLRAEARLAQAERATAVTEAHLVKAWTDFLDANPDDLNSPDDLPNHALMTGDQFVQYASTALEAVLAEPQQAVTETEK